MKEIECKIMGLSSDGFETLAINNGIRLQYRGKYNIKDIYWLSPNLPMIRLRGKEPAERLEEILMSTLNAYTKDLTVKGPAESTNISKREEIILDIDSIAQAEDFLLALGYQKHIDIHKVRSVWRYQLEKSYIHIQADYLPEYDLRWVEIEAPTEKDLDKFLEKMNIDKKCLEIRETLDLIKEKNET